LKGKSLHYIPNEEFTDLRDSLEETSKFINSYCKGIIGKTGIKD
jgi:hypothetical protein